MFLFFLYLHGEDSGFNSEVLLNTVCLYFMFFTNPLLLSMSVHLSYCSVVYLFAFQWSRSFRGVFGETNQSELAAFTSYALAFPNNFLALVDTYDVSKAFANYLVMFNYCHCGLLSYLTSLQKTWFSGWGFLCFAPWSSLSHLKYVSP